MSLLGFGRGLSRSVCGSIYRSEILARYIKRWKYVVKVAVDPGDTLVVVEIALMVEDPVISWQLGWHE
jgi:hypothetical protein